jgi:hypothetical protein
MFFTVLERFNFLRLSFVKNSNTELEKYIGIIYRIQIIQTNSGSNPAAFPIYRKAQSPGRRVKTTPEAIKKVRLNKLFKKIFKQMFPTRA